jgi:hypothetical protein
VGLSGSVPEKSVWFGQLPVARHPPQRQNSQLPKADYRTHLVGARPRFLPLPATRELSPGGSNQKCGARPEPYTTKAVAIQPIDQCKRILMHTSRWLIFAPSSGRMRCGSRGVNDQPLYVQVSVWQTVSNNRVGPRPGIASRLRGTGESRTSTRVHPVERLLASWLGNADHLVGMGVAFIPAWTAPPSGRSTHFNSVAARMKASRHHRWESHTCARRRWQRVRKISAPSRETSQESSLGPIRLLNSRAVLPTMIGTSACS